MTYSLVCGMCGRSVDAVALVPRLSQYLHEVLATGQEQLIRLLLRNAASLRGWSFKNTYGDMHDLCPGCSVQLRHGL
jgi:hypothetical protein